MAVCHGQTALHTKRGELASQNRNISSGNHSFGSHIRLRMHLRASRTSLASRGLVQPPDPWPQWQCSTGRRSCTPKKGRSRLIVFSKQKYFHLESLIWVRLRMHHKASRTSLAFGGLVQPPDPWPQWPWATGRRSCTPNKRLKVD